MARIFITGSSTGLGLLAGRELARAAHDVVLHARSTRRAEDARAELPQASDVLVGDLETVAGTQAVAAQANALGRFDAVIHNAAVGYGEGRHVTPDGLPGIFAVNVLAPYMLTALVEPPARLVYLSSSMHLGVDAALDDPLWERQRWSGSAAYSQSKLHILMLAFAIARLWPGTKANGVDPGWVPTRMGGSSAPGDLADGVATQVMLAAPTVDSRFENITGQYFHDMKISQPNPQALDVSAQTRLLDLCAAHSGVVLKP